jgi:hypothetical protein
MNGHEMPGIHLFGLHYPLARPWWLRWLPRRCSCGADRYERCPDR